ncbi:hypothetical protein TrVE_jg2099 [Triparma verrucosa]|uniref:Transmembrane protein 186 n=1 Tax=Triparma verrucosa TaxID=1606542 RepID=A0A9W7CM54_9STRA|nr:hypothetical protein TrVE_jg2099 [Triparma verrucosa]
MLHLHTGHLLLRSFSFRVSPSLINSSSHRFITSKSENKIVPEVLKYVGPFANLTHRLKRVSLLTASIGLILPLTSLYTTSSVPPIGQIAVTSVALTTAVGSTALLNYCVSPYVHRLSEREGRFEAVTVDFWARKINTKFELDDVTSSSALARPFCNFVAKGVPMYVHGELMNDKKLLKRLVKRELSKGEREGRSDDPDVED